MKHHTLRTATARITKTGGYVEASRVRTTTHENASTDFVVISRGFTVNGIKTWTRFITLPHQRDVLQFLAAELIVEAAHAGSTTPARVLADVAARLGGV